MATTRATSSVFRALYLPVICGVAALGGLLFGFDTAVISGSDPLFTQEFGLSPEMEGWVVGSAIVGCFWGALGAGVLSDRFGRKKVLLLSALFFMGSAVWCGLAGSAQDLVYARLVGGLGIGIASLVSPLYIAEISPARIRGRLVALQQLAIVLGILGAFFSNNEVLGTAWSDGAKWRWMLAIGAFPAALFFVLILPIPESPRWLTKQGHRDRARWILARVVGEAEADREMGEIGEAISREGGMWGDLWRPGLRRAVFVGVTLAVLTQVTGINAIMYYAPEVFKQAGFEAADAYGHSVWVGLTNLVFTVAAMVLVDRLGRKPLLLIGAACMGVALGGVGYAFYTQAAGRGVLAGVLAYVASFAFSMGVVGWVLISEIYPTRTRGRAMSLATSAVWGACYAVSQTFPMLIKKEGPLGDHAGPHVAFWLYAAMCAVALVFIGRYVPETKGRSLEEIERSWR
ncbi:MAG: sugar porter family MFS transporter [Verrucomicrobia bacterium]|nr:sugar porter family MFS transporter [Verrucomicrobiota bacterium]